MSFRSHRYPTVFPVEMISTAGARRIDLVNITASGAGLMNVHSIALGDVVTLNSAVGRFSGTVCWIDGDQCGLFFRQRLTPRQVDQLRHAPTAGGPQKLRQSHSFRELR